MKKLVLLTMMLVSNLMLAHAQTDTIMYIAEMGGNVYHICLTEHERAIVFGPNGCSNPSWVINYDYDHVLTGDSVILDGNNSGSYSIQFGGWNCGQYSSLLYFIQPTTLNETTDILWKHQHFPIELSIDSLPGLPSSYPPPLQHYDFLWSTGETAEAIEVTEPGTYTCDISEMCATVTRTFIVRDNVECYHATVDLETNLNKVTWQVIPEQAEYISAVKVERDGFVVGTVPYEQGYFTDNIGSENAARNYRLTGIDTDGNECPIPSYQKGTLHVDYSPNASNPNKLNMAWTPPFIEEGASVSVTYFQICKYDPTTGEVTVIDQLGANNTIASYNRDLFEGGYAVIGVVFNYGRADEEVSFSNRSEDIILAVGEQQGRDFRIYPNPAKDRVTIEGTGEAIITNTLGQIILTCEIDGKETIALPQGMYFVKMNGVTRKIVVE